MADEYGEEVKEKKGEKRGVENGIPEEGAAGEVSGFDVFVVCGVFAFEGVEGSVSSREFAQVLKCLRHWGEVLQSSECQRCVVRETEFGDA